MQHAAGNLAWLLLLLWPVLATENHTSAPSAWESACTNFQTVEKIKFFVYPLNASLPQLAEANARAFERNKGWVLNDWNQHNQYSLEYVFHQNLLATPDLITNDPEQATHFFIP